MQGNGGVVLNSKKSCEVDDAREHKQQRLNGFDVLVP